MRTSYPVGIGRRSVHKLSDTSSSVASTHAYLELPIMLALYAGLDPMDFRALEWKDIDLKKGTIITTRGKTGLPIHVPIAPPLAARLCQSPCICGPVCRGLPSRADNLRKALNRLVERAKVVPGGGWKKFRHTFATTLALNGVPLPTMRALMAHSPKSAEILVYLHTDDRSAREAIERTFGE